MEQCTEDVATLSAQLSEAERLQTVKHGRTASRFATSRLRLPVIPIISCANGEFEPRIVREEWLVYRFSNVTRRSKVFATHPVNVASGHSKITRYCVENLLENSLRDTLAYFTHRKTKFSSFSENESYNLHSIVVLLKN